MTAHPIELVAAPTVSQETLDTTPERAIKLLRGIGTIPMIRAALAARGYTQAEHDRGWSLLQAASGYSHATDFGLDVDSATRDAIAQVDAWEEDGLRTVRAALTYRHPQQANVLLAGLSPTHGAGAVVTVATLLDRLDALAASAAPEDAAAAAMLASRGLDDAERRRVRALVDIAKRGAAPAAPDPRVQAEEASAAAHQAALVGLRAWYEEWSEMAKIAIKRRDRLIRLGLAKRKSPTRATPKSADAPPVSGAAAKTA